MASQLLGKALVFAILVGVTSYVVLVTVVLVCAFLMVGFDTIMSEKYESLLALLCIILGICILWKLFVYSLQTTLPEYVFKHPRSNTILQFSFIILLSLSIIKEEMFVLVLVFSLVSYTLSRCSYFFRHRQQQSSSSSAVASSSPSSQQELISTSSTATTQEVVIHDDEPPEVVRARTPHPQTGRLLLHEECTVTRDHDPSEERIYELLRLNPEAANIRETGRSRYDWTKVPLDLLIHSAGTYKKHNAISKQLLVALFQATSPNVLSIIYWRGNELTEGRSNIVNAAKHYISFYPYWTDLHMALMEVYPTVVQQASEQHGINLLYRACESQRFFGPLASPELIQAIVNVYPQGAFQQKSPLRQQQSRYAWLPLHVICNEGGPVENVRIIIRANRDALLVADEFGRLPIHLACQRDENEGMQPNLNVIAELIQEAPETMLRSAPLLDIHEDQVIDGSMMTPLQMLFERANPHNNSVGFNPISRVLFDLTGYEGNIVEDFDGLTQTDIVEHVLCRAIVGNSITQHTIQRMFEEYPAASDIDKCNPITHDPILHKSMFMYAWEQFSNITTTPTATMHNHRLSSNIVSIAGYFIATHFPTFDMLSKLLFGDEKNNENSNEKILHYLFHWMVLRLHKHYINNNSSIIINNDEDNANHNETGTDGSNSNNHNDVDAADDDTTNSNNNNNNNNNSDEVFHIGSTNILFSILRRDPNIIQSYGKGIDNI